MNKRINEDVKLMMDSMIKTSMKKNEEPAYFRQNPWRLLQYLHEIVFNASKTYEKMVIRFYLVPLKIPDNVSKIKRTFIEIK